ncbi:MAG: alpha-2-macroglobulin, partial [Lentisphaeria bacterium]|nr:alpha-2-macroglobulin [Lentisphaeria bacterium]
HKIEGAYFCVVQGKGFTGERFHFNKLELVPDKMDYQPGETVKLMINTDFTGSTVYLFTRPVNGTYKKPQIVRMKGKSHIVEIPITKKDMPNFFVEAFTVYRGKYHHAMKEIIVPPEKRVLNVKVIPSKEKYKPGEKASLKIKVTDFNGEPFIGSTVLSVYDKSVEYISGGTNIKDIKEYFWKWRRHHYPRHMHSLQKRFNNLLKKHEKKLAFIGVFGNTLQPVQKELGANYELKKNKGKVMRQRSAKASVAKSDFASKDADKMEMEESEANEGGFGDDDEAGGVADKFVEATVRKNFADTAYWNGAIITNKKGEAELSFDMPENLTTWKVKLWTMGKGMRVGEGSTEIITTKNLLLRLQAPRFFVQKDEVVLSANVHNYLATAKKVKVVLEINDVLKSLNNNLVQTVTIEAHGEKRIDWRVKVTKEGTALVLMKALTDEESDAMEMNFPAKVHGMLKTVSYSGHLRSTDKSSVFTIDVPKDRRPDDSVLEIRYSPTLAGAMVDALPYLVAYPYGCTEQTLSRFLPTVMTQKILTDMNLDLDDIMLKQSNLNAQEIGDDKERMAQWKKQGRRIVGYKKNGDAIWSNNPVFSKAIVEDMIKVSVIRLMNMQLSDGGWGWFSGYGERSYAHTTAYVVHGLQMAKEYGATIPQNSIDRGINWLRSYQNKELAKLKRYSKKIHRKHSKTYADNMDAFVYMVLVDANVNNKGMLSFLFRDRNKLSVYAKAMFGIACHRIKDMKKRDMLIRNIEQFLKKDPENQTAYLELGNQNYWWYWYGSEYEAHAYYLKLLARVKPKSDTAAWMVKYLINNRKNATYWKSTRDTAICIEAIADYMRAAKEDKPDMSLDIFVDGKKLKTVKINSKNIFSFDNKLILKAGEISTGKHKIEFRKTGTGPLYYNAYFSYFSLEDHITKAGLEIKVQRKYFKLERVDKDIHSSGTRGQAVKQKVEKYKRIPIKNLDHVKSGDLLEIELSIESKNDYEYVIFEDMKAAGCEPYKVRSGYTRNGFSAYMELRDDRVAFFCRVLPRGKHSISYRMRAEIPGKFSALPTKAYAMYAPELRGNSDEIKIHIDDVDILKLKK